MPNHTDSDTDTTTQYRVPNQYARDYLSRSENTTLAPSSVQSYDTHLTEFVTFLHGSDQTVLTAEFTDILDYLDDCVRRNNRQSTLKAKLSVISEFYRYIRLRTDAGDKLNLDPIRLRDIDLNKYNTPAKIEREALSKEEIHRLFDAFDSYRNRLMAIVGVETGLRNSDIRNIRLKDFHEDDNLLHVHDPKNSIPYDVPISDQLSFEFTYWLKHHRDAYPQATDSQYVFLSQHGGKLAHNGSFNQTVKAAANRAGIQETIGRSKLTDTQQQAMSTDAKYREWHRVTAHTLRHSFITLLKDAGVSLPYRMLVANHSNAETNLGYTHGDRQAFDPVRNQYDPPR